MQLQVIKGLQEPIWIKVDGDEELELQIVPAGVDVFSSLLVGELERKLICQEFFVGFRGYYDGDQPVPNTIERRMELLRWTPVRRALNQQAQVIASRNVQGEADAVSV